MDLQDGRLTETKSSFAALRGRNQEPPGVVGLKLSSGSLDQEQMKNFRTFTAQIEVLGRLRGVGRQTVEVTHTHIDARGSQSIIGDVTVRGMGAPVESLIDLMHPPLSPTLRLQSACCCGAKTRSGTPCQSPAIRGRKRCRMHCSASPGGQPGRANGRYRTGLNTAEHKAEMRKLAELVAEWRDLRRSLYA